MVNLVISFAESTASSFTELPELDFDDITIVSQNSNRIVATSGDYRIALRGSIDSDDINASEINQINLSYDGVRILTAKDLSLTAGDLDGDIQSILADQLKRGDTIVSDDSAGDSWATRSGADVISLGIGDDTVNGGKGVDTYVINDEISNVDADFLDGTIFLSSDYGNDILTNVEILEFTDITLAVTQTDEDASGDQFAATKNDFLVGTDASQTLEGGNGRDAIFGDGGADTLCGGRGADIIDGFTGRDLLKGQRGADTLDGGDGRDTLKGGSGNDDLFAGGGRDKLTGGGDDDTFIFGDDDGINIITDFGNGDDMIDIRSGADSLDDLTFSQNGTTAVVTYADTEIRVKNMMIEDLETSDYFSF